MDIKINYQPTAKELSRASLLFAEKKPFMRVSVGMLNLITGFFLIVFILKIFFLGINLPEIITALVCSLWLFGRRPFNEWLLHKRMKNSRVSEKPISIEISLNGIVWSGKGLKQGHMAWSDIKYVFETQNGFILPNTFTRFLWLPYRGFRTPEEIKQFKAYVLEQNIKYHTFEKWVC